jgi:hypothetical protein
MHKLVFLAARALSIGFTSDRTSVPMNTSICTRGRRSFLPLHMRLCVHCGSLYKHITRTDPAIMDLLDHTSWLGSKTWMAKSDLIGGTRVFLGSFLLCDGGYHKWPCLVYPKKKVGLPGSHERKGCGLIESVQKNIEGTFGMLKRGLHS